MIHSNLICVAVTLFVLSIGQASAINDPEKAIGIALAQSHMQTAVRAAKSKKFTGSFKGTHEFFGMKGTDEGKFSGTSTKKKAKGHVSGETKGDADMFGTKGKYSSKYSGKFTSRDKGKKGQFENENDFEFTYKGMYGGMEHSAKASGSFYIEYDNGKVLMTERGTMNGRWMGKKFKGTYKSKYEDDTFSMKLRGTVDGKKVKIDWRFMLEDMEKLFDFKGTYEVVCDGKKSTGKYDKWEIIPHEPKS